MSTIHVTAGVPRGVRTSKGWSHAHALGALTAGLAIVGTVLVGSASQVISLSLFGSPWAIFARQCLWLGLGFVALWLFARIDYHRLERLAPVALGGSFLMLVAVLMPGVGTKVTGSARWIGIGAFSIQPSEIMKVSLVVFAASAVARKKACGAREVKVVRPVLMVTGLAAVLVVRQPDLGTAIVLIVIMFSVLLGAGVGGWALSGIGAGGVSLALIAAAASPYRRARLLSFIHPSVHVAGAGYQVLQSMLGVGSGGLFGAGLGNGWIQWGYLPNAQTDFIYSVICQELGLLGGVGVLALLIGFCWLAVGVAQRARDELGMLLAIGIAGWIAAETFMNMGAVLGLLPVTGIPLPFISYGGSSLVVTMAAAGILCSVARYGDATARTRVR